MITLIIATRNSHKVEEIQAILGGQFHHLTLDDFSGAPKVIEDAPTFSGNATKKAVELARWIAADNDPRSKIHDSQTFVLADDSGLEVDALNGAPGVHSARFAADDKTSGNSPDAANCEKLLRLLKDVSTEKRTARFRCVIALTPVVGKNTESSSPVCYGDEMELRTALFEGACEGRIGFKQCGSNGFGYDPLFLPEGFQETFAELSDAEKNKLSHRANALAKLRDYLAGLPN